MNIKEGIFNKDIDGYAIRIGSKDKDGQSIKDIIIYDHSTGNGNNNIILAEDGKMYPTENGKYLVFELHNGWRYEEDNEAKDLKQTRMHFDKWYKVFDLSKFAFKRTQEDLFKSNEEMMTVQQLNKHIDTMGISYQSSITQLGKYLNPYYSILDNKKEDSSLNKQLLKEAGFPGGAGLEPIKLLTVPVPRILIIVLAPGAPVF